MPNLFERFRVLSKFGEAKVTKKREQCKRKTIFLLHFRAKDCTVTLSNLCFTSTNFEKNDCYFTDFVQFMQVLHRKSPSTLPLLCLYFASTKFSSSSTYYILLSKSLASKSPCHLPTLKLHVPTLGMSCSHAGNTSFPRWEC